MRTQEHPWMNAAIFDENQRDLTRLAFLAVSDVNEFNSIADVIDANIAFLEQCLDEWDRKQIEHEENEEFDKNVLAFEKALGREITREEWQGIVPFGWNGTEEEYKEWEKNYIESRKRSDN